MWSVSLYEFKWDIRKKKVYAAVGIVALIVIGVGIFYKSLLGGVGAPQSSQSYLWDDLVVVVTNDFLSGVFPLMVGVLVAIDSIAWEYDKGTILPLFSQPLSRGEIYTGKVVEKVLLLLTTSLVIVAMAVIVAEIVAGAQQYLVWTFAVAFGFLLETMVFASLGFLLGTIIKSPGLLLVGILVVFFGILFGGIIGDAKYGLKAWMAWIPIVNINFIQGAIQDYFLNPGGNMIINYNVGSVTGSASFPTAGILFDSLVGVTITVIAFLVFGFLMFRRMEIKG